MFFYWQALLKQYIQNALLFGLMSLFLIFMYFMGQVILLESILQFCWDILYFFTIKYESFSRTVFGINAPTYLEIKRQMMTLSLIFITLLFIFLMPLNLEFQLLPKTLSRFYLLLTNKIKNIRIRLFIFYSSNLIILTLWHYIICLPIIKKGHLFSF